MRSIFEEARLFDSNPSAYLPHANPFLFIDRVLSLDSGSSAEGLKVVTHDPAGYPQVFLIESMAQLAGIAAAREEGKGGFLASVDHAEFSGEVREGDRIIISVRIVKSFGRLHLCEGEAMVDGKRVASASLTLGVGKL
jgi:3-hydroxyacyl-[acyl-carrier-protein] dehydratase